MYNTNLIMLLVLLMITLRATHVACQEMSSTEVYLQKGMYPSQLAISPEGKQIIICGTDINSLLSFELDNDGLFDFSNGHEMPANNDKLTSIENCMFSSDGKSVIARSSGTYDLFIWSRDETFQTLGQINPASVVKVTLGDAVDFEVSNSKGMDISPDGKQVFTIGGRKLVYFDRVLDPTTNRWILQNKMAIKLVDDSICDVKVTPDNKQVFISIAKANSGNGGKIMSWNRKNVNGEMKLSDTYDAYETENENGCALAFSPDSKSLYMVSDGTAGVNNIFHWTRTEGGALQETPDVTEVLDFSFTYKRAQVKVSPDGLNVFISTSSFPEEATIEYMPEALVRFDRSAENGALTNRYVASQGINTGQRVNLKALEISPSGNNVYATAKTAGKIIIWNQQVCSNTGGVNNNHGVCVCGGTTCNQEVGYKCTEAENYCSHLPKCLDDNLRLTTLNTEDCHCGSNNVVCTAASGRYCFKKEDFSGSCSNNTCPASHYRSPPLGGCTPCPAGTWAPVAFLCGSFVDRCKPVAECSAEKQNGGKCSAGKYSDETGLISDNQCKNCSAGTMSKDTGATSCTPCVVGRYSTVASSKCEICQFGQYQPEQGGGTCLECGVGTYLSDPATNIKFHDDIDDCQVCIGPRFNDLTGQGSCKDCEPGKAINSPLASQHNSSDDCKTKCEASEYMDGDGCKLCEPGYICDGVTQKDCTAGKYCIDSTEYSCKPGKFGIYARSKTEDEACNLCFTGQYQPGEGSTSCFDCDSGKYNPTKGGTHEDICHGCEIGSKCPQRGMSASQTCKTGHFNPFENQTSCEPCPLNTYNNKEGQTSNASCTKCPNNKKTTATGATTSYECQTNELICISKEDELAKRPIQDNCFPCPKGYQGNSHGTGCLLCQQGFYSEVLGANKCLECELNDPWCWYSPGSTRTSSAASSGATDSTVLFFIPNQNDIVNTTVYQTSRYTDAAATTSNNIATDALYRWEDQLQSMSTAIYWTLFSFIGLLLSSHRCCPMCFKNFDLMFAGDHYIFDTHAKRMLDTRLGATFTMSLPFVLGLAFVFVFSVDNVLISSALVPAVSIALDTTNQTLFGSLNITFESYSMTSDLSCNNEISFDAAQISNNMACSHTFKESMQNAVGTYCALDIYCELSGSYRGKNEMNFALSDSFQNIKWSMVPSSWNSTSNSSLMSGSFGPSSKLILSGSKNAPTKLKYGVVRSQFRDITRDQVTNPFYYGVQLSWLGLKREESNTGLSNVGLSNNGKHYVAMVFDVQESVYVKEDSDKLSLTTRLTTVFTLLLSAMSVMRLTKMYSELALDKIITVNAECNGSHLPEDVRVRTAILIEDTLRKKLKSIGANSINVEMGRIMDGGGNGLTTAPGRMSMVNPMDKQNQMKLMGVIEKQGKQIEVLEEQVRVLMESVGSGGSVGSGSSVGGGASLKKKKKKALTNKLKLKGEKEVHLDAASGLRYSYDPKTGVTEWLDKE